SETIVFNSVKDMVEKNVKFIRIKKENFLENLMAKLYENQIQSVIVEGGSFTLQQFRSEEHTSELQSRENLVCRLLPEREEAYPRCGCGCSGRGGCRPGCRARRPAPAGQARAPVPQRPRAERREWHRETPDYTSAVCRT